MTRCTESTTTKVNVFGENDTVTDALGGQLVYSYHPFGLLKSVEKKDTSGSSSSVTKLSYDARGNKIELDDPDKGRWS